MYIDSNNTCRYNKSALSEDFIKMNLPYFTCNTSNYKSLLQIICYFTLPIQDLDSLDKDSIQI